MRARRCSSTLSSPASRSATSSSAAPPAAVGHPGPLPARARAGRGRPRRPHPLRPRRRRARDRPPVRLQGLRIELAGPADGAARPRRAGGRGRALQDLRAGSVRGQLHAEPHSKLLLGLAVPYDGELTCEHLDSLSPVPIAAARSGKSRSRCRRQPLPPGERQPDRRRGPRARRRCLPRRRRRPQLHQLLLEPDPAAAAAAGRGAHPLRQLLQASGRPDRVRRQSQVARLPDEFGAVSSRSSWRRCRARTWRRRTS